MSKVFLVSLGCSKNLVDSEHLIGRLSKKDFSLTPYAPDADVFLINTCGFIGPAREEGYQTIEEALAWKKKGGGVVAVVGCLAQRETDYLGERYPAIDVISGFGGYRELASSIRKAQLGNPIRNTVKNQYQVPTAIYPSRLTGGASAYLKLGEGCSKRCAFCSIPHIRGNQVSVPLPDIIARAKALADEGVKELLLIAQDPVTYGKDLPLARDLLSVIDALEAIPGIEWIRLHYLYPSPVVHRLLDRLEEGGKLLPYIDMPLQHVNEAMLKRMNRPSLAPTEKLLKRAKENIKDVTLRTTFIVGFPGETDKTVEEVAQFIRACRFDKVGVFSFSPEKGTPAFDLADQVASEAKEEYRRYLMTVAGEVSLELHREKLGRQLDVIVDIPPTEKRGIGRTRGQSLEVDGITYLEPPGPRTKPSRDKRSKFRPGDIISANIVDFDAHDLYAHCLVDG